MNRGKSEKDLSNALTKFFNKYPNGKFEYAKSGKTLIIIPEDKLSISGIKELTKSLMDDCEAVNNLHSIDVGFGLSVEDFIKMFS